jgi:hypothetical protein
VTGLLSVTGNILSGAQISAIGNLNGAGFVTAGSGGSISGTGNITGGNFLTGGVMSATGNITGGNVIATTISNAASFTGGLVSVTGNITGGNVIATTISNAASFTGGLVSVTGAITGGGLVTGSGGVVAQTVAAQGYGVRVIAATTDANATIQFTNTAQNVQWATITANAVNSLLLSATTTTATGSFVTPGTITVNSGAAATAIINGAGNAVGNIGSSSTYFNNIFAQATTALYADLAEMYVSDAVYEPGTVVVFGGDQEITISMVEASRRVAGVISTNPAHVMNSGLQGEFTLAVALSGRVPTLVVGPVAKGDMMVSAGNGRARAESDPILGSVIGKALQDFNGTTGTIEIVVGRL